MAATKISKTTPEVITPVSPLLAIELEGISKSFGAVHANKDISLAVLKGSIHGIVGENGAGKSTLMSILYGFYQADRGEIRVDEKPVKITTPQHAIDAGIGMVHQHFMLVPNFTVLENIIMGAESGALLKGSLTEARRLLTEIEVEYGLDVDPDAVVEHLSVGMQQRVEILKALYRQAEILILDEPTGVLTPSEANHLFLILRKMKGQGKTIIIITHKLREIMAVTDTVSVMRQGQMTATVKTSETTSANLAELMVGRSVVLHVEKREATLGKTLLIASGLTIEKDGVRTLDNVSFTLRAGEILGVAGVAGNGQSELLDVIAGINPATSGTLSLKGRDISLSSGYLAKTRRDAGIGHIPEDRHKRGLIMRFKAWENAVFGYHHRNDAGGGGYLVDKHQRLADATKKIKEYDVRPADPNLEACNFSGGNQQKIVIARELESNPDVLLVGQPTRGVDIGAIEFIHRRLIELRDAGKAILLVSVELDEVLSLSDRVIVMFDGKIVGERVTSKTNEKEIGLLMAGVTENLEISK